MNPKIGFVAHYRGMTFAANVGPGDDQVVLFSDSSAPVAGFEQAAGGYWRKQVRRDEVSWLVLIRTLAMFGGEPCMVLADEEDGVHIAYTGHDGARALELGYWEVDHGAYEVVVSPDEVEGIRVDQVDLPSGPGWRDKT